MSDELSQLDLNRLDRLIGAAEKCGRSTVQLDTRLARAMMDDNERLRREIEIASVAKEQANR